MVTLTINALTCDCEDAGLVCCHARQREARRAARQDYKEVEAESSVRAACADCGEGGPVSLMRWVTRFPTLTVPLCPDCYIEDGRQNEARREVRSVDKKWHPA